MSPRRPASARPGSRPGVRATASRSAGGRRRPVRTEASAQSPASSRGEEPARATPAKNSDPRPGGTAPAGRPPAEHTLLRLGGAGGIAVPARVLVLALVLLAAFIVIFPSLRGYLHQQSQYDAVVKEIASAQATSTALEQELAQWKDDDYIKAQARDRLSYVMPGETTYVVVGAQDFEDSSTSGGSASGAAAAQTPWYETLRETSRVAGESGARQPEPAQQGWSTAMPTQPTPSAKPTDLSAYSRTLGEP